VRLIKQEDTAARLIETRTTVEPINGIAVELVRYTVEGLPDAQAGIGYIVSRELQAALPNRPDLFVASQGLDAEGRPYQRLTANNSYPALNETIARHARQTDSNNTVTALTTMFKHKQNKPKNAPTDSRVVAATYTTANGRSGLIIKAHPSLVKQLPLNEWKIVTGQAVNHGTQDGLEVIEIDQLASGWVLVSAALSIQIAAGQLVARQNLGYGNEASVANLNEGDQFTVISHNERSRQTYQVNSGTVSPVHSASPPD